MSTKPESNLLDDLLTVEEAAELLRVRPRYLYDAVNRRTIPYTKVGRYVRFSRRELEAWLRESHTSIGATE